MPLPWIKVHLSLIDNDIFLALSAAARGTFVICLPLAEKCSSDGALALRTGPMTIAQIARYTGLQAGVQRKALEELCGALLFERSEPNGYRVLRFSEFQGNVSTERTRAFRERSKNVLETQAERSGNALDTDTDTDTDTESLPASQGDSAPAKAPKGSRKAKAIVDCCCSSDPPSMPEFSSPEEVVDDLLEVFANCKADGAKDKHRPVWLGALRELRQRYRLTWKQIWSALSTVHADSKHAPIFAFSAVWPNVRARLASDSSVSQATIADLPIGWESNPESAI